MKRAMGGFVVMLIAFLSILLGKINHFVDMIWEFAIFVQEEKALFPVVKIV